MAKKSLTYKDVYQTLSNIDIKDNVQYKYGISFLSWAYVWHTLMENYPNSVVTFSKFLDKDGIERDVLYYPDGTAMVHCIVGIEEYNENSIIRDMWLPVMDHKFKAVKNPTSRQISDSKQRCFVKCMGLFGLGLNLWLGEDLPKKEEPKLASAKQKTYVGKLLSETGSEPMSDEEYDKLSADEASQLIDKLSALPKLEVQ